MWKATREYLDALAAARDAVHAAVPEAEMPADLRRAVEEQIVARWRHQPGNRLLVFRSSGKFDNRSRENHWTFEDGRLTLKWDNPRSPGGVFVTTCDVAADGQSYTGVNQRNGKVSGTYAGEER
jgi:hypothetical protein